MSPQIGARGNPVSFNFMADGTTAKGLALILDDSIDTLYEAIGNQNKVRSFYNNLYDPSNRGMTTIDTHAVAAALLLPLSSSSPAVYDNFSSFDNKASGNKGTYPIYQEAYERAAAIVGVLPREMQSITWEMVRVFFEPRIKPGKPAEEKAVREDPRHAEVWGAYDRGEITAEEARKRVIKTSIGSKIYDIWTEHDEGKITAEEARAKIVDVVGPPSPLAWAESPFDKTVGWTYDRSGIQLYPHLKRATLKPTISFRIDPPAGSALSREFELLSPEQQAQVSQRVAQSVLFELGGILKTHASEVRATYGADTSGQFRSLSIQLEPGAPVMEAAAIIARVFNQDSVSVLSDTNEAGLTKRRALRIDVNWDAEDSVRSDIWEKVLSKVSRDETGAAPRKRIEKVLTSTTSLVSTFDPADEATVKAEVSELIKGVPGSHELSFDDAYAGDVGQMILEGEPYAGQVDKQGGIRREVRADAALSDAVRALSARANEEFARAIRESASTEPRSYSAEFERYGLSGKRGRHSAQLKAGRVVRGLGRGVVRGGVRNFGDVGLRLKEAWGADECMREFYALNGMDAPTLLELENSKENAQAFADAITAAKKGNASGAAVYVYPVEEYQKMKLFLTADRRAGVAVKPSGDIVSVFNNKAGRGVVHTLLEVAVANGGTMLDCFDTVLPKFYAAHGFRAVARQVWNDEYKPDGWDYEAFKAFNNGRPDVVYMALDPNYFGSYGAQDGTFVTEYDDAVAMQKDAAYAFQGQPNPDVLLQIETPLPGPGERAQTAEQASRYDPFLAVEVAPDPNDAQAVANWEELNAKGKQSVTDKVLPKVLDLIARATGAKFGGHQNQLGGWHGGINPSKAIPVLEGNPLVLAGVVAKVLRQESVMVLSDTEVKGMSKSSVLRIRFTDELNEKQFEERATDLYKNVLDKIIDEENPTVKDKDGNDVPNRLVEGMSATGGVIFSTVKSDDVEKILAGFQKALNGMPYDERVEFFFEDGYSAFPGPITQEEENGKIAYKGRGSEGVPASRYSDFLRAEADKEISDAIAEAKRKPENLRSSDSGAEGQTLKQINIRPEQLPPDVAPQDRLVVLHETTIEKLLKSLKLGGLPMPSLGITKWLRPYSGFGDIALIGTAGMIDPASGTDVYSADAYTVRFPGLEKEVDKDVIHKLVTDITKTAAPYGHSLSEAWLMANLGHKIFGNSDIIDVLEKSPAAQVAFLLEEDVDIAPVEFEPRGGRSHAPGLFRSEAFRKLCEEWLELESPSRKDYLRIGKALNAAARKLPLGAWDGASDFVRLLWLVSDEQPKYLTQFAGLVLGREEVVKSPQFTAQVLNKVKIEEAFSDNEGEFRSWAKRKTKGWLGNPMLRLGGKLVPVTLENVLKAMLLERGRNREAGSQGFSNSEIIAAGARQFESMDEIRANRGQVDDSIESYEKIQAVEKAIDNYERVVTGGAWANGVAARKALVEAAKVKKPTERRLRTALEKAGFDVTQEMLDAGMAAINEVKHAVTMYFEAKPPRAVGFDEFVGAVVPEGTSEEVINALKGYGLEIETYGWKLNAFDRAVKDLSARMQEKRGDVLFQKARQGDENIAGSYNPKTNTLRLTANANPSTFAHEMGHWFLEQSCAAARLPTCSKSFVADLEAMLRSMGVDGLAGWEAADWATRERIHEQWAAHVETYLSEGRAPNAESKPFLRRLAQMIRDFYRAWKTGTDTATRARYRMQFGEEMPDLSPEVRRARPHDRGRGRRARGGKEARPLGPL